MSSRAAAGIRALEHLAVGSAQDSAAHVPLAHVGLMDLDEDGR
jgi:hypothetical protein